VDKRNKLMRALHYSKENSRYARSMLLACTVLTASLLAGCGSLQKPPLREPVTRELPDPPDYLRPAEVPPAREGSSPFVVSEQRGAVIERQNTVIVRAREAWHTMKRTYSTSKGLIRKGLFGR
jgi:hypothetical protein